MASSTPSSFFLMFENTIQDVQYHENTIQDVQYQYHLRLYSIKDKKQYVVPLVQNLNENFRSIVSSHGWLAFSDKSGNYPFLLNPFSSTWINLPPKPAFIPQFYSNNILKVVVSGTSQNPRAVVISYGFPFMMKIASCKIGDEQWSNLGCPGTTYYDFVCCDQTNTAFALGPGLSVESWDLNDAAVPMKKKTLIGPRILELANHTTYPSNLYATRYYLASSSGHVFLVLRYIREFETYEEEIFVSSCPYKTVNFHVYKLDVYANKWMEVVCLGDGTAMLVGGNHATIASTVEHPELVNNTIYFSDDFWERLDYDCLYGGHDIGIFRLEDGSIESILDSQQPKTHEESPPFWITLPRT